MAANTIEKVVDQLFGTARGKLCYTV